MKILGIDTEKRRRGDLGEKVAADFLEKNGYKILERNFVGAGNEIDIVATNKERDTTVFIEVKTRIQSTVNSRFSRPAAAVTPEKQRKIISASKIYMKKLKYKTKMRYDVIEVYLEKTEGEDKVSDIKHLVSTFDYNTAYDKAYFYKKTKGL